MFAPLFVNILSSNVCRMKLWFNRGEHSSCHFVCFSSYFVLYSQSSVPSKYHNSRHKSHAHRAIPTYESLVLGHDAYSYYGNLNFFFFSCTTRVSSISGQIKFVGLNHNEMGRKLLCLNYHFLTIV